jgi:hypothetical protein
MPDEPKLGRHGGRRIKGGQGAIGTLKRGSHSKRYIIARLKRDQLLELAARVERGETSARSAAREAGFGLGREAQRRERDLRLRAVESLIG